MARPKKGRGTMGLSVREGPKRRRKMKGCRGEDDEMGAALVILEQDKATGHGTGQGKQASKQASRPASRVEEAWSRMRLHSGYERGPTR
jgi:hypothetical protein